MPSIVTLGSRTRLAAALVAASVCVAAALATFAACLTAAPPDIGTSTNARPEILHTAVQPAEGLLDEYQWPTDGFFIVPIILSNPTEPCTWRVFDEDLEQPPAPGQAPTLVTDSPACVTTVVDAGFLQDVPIQQPTDGHCHKFTFIVAHGFSALNVPDSIGGDAVSWYYEPSNALCRYYDAGAFQDGAFPPVDAAADRPPITPESGPADVGVDP
jgi:hypothetical protein